MCAAPGCPACGHPGLSAGGVRGGDQPDHGPAIVGVGAVTGILGALGLTRVMARFLYGISAHDRVTYSGVTMLVAAVALVACYIPARRATKVDPMAAMPYE